MSLAKQFHEEGFVTLPCVIEEAECDAAIEGLRSIPRRSAGTRNLLSRSWCRTIAASLKSNPAIAALLPSEAVATQCTLFDKSPDMNWSVTLHQDLSIAVLERVDDPACFGWSEKEGVLYTQPPASVIASLVAVRVHLDECTTENGPLRVIPGSHLGGRISNHKVRAGRAQGEVECLVPKGGALIMQPLLLHASSKAKGRLRRRVMHFLFGPPALPHGLRWHVSI